MAGPKRARHLQVPRAAYPRHFRPECLGELYGERSHPARSALDQHFLARLDIPFVAQALEGGQRG